MGRHTQIHETTRYEVVIRGIQSRAEAEAIVSAVEALPSAGAWIPPAPLPAPGKMLVVEEGTLYEIQEDGTPKPLGAIPAFADADDNVGALKAGEAHREGEA